MKNKATFIIIALFWLVIIAGFVGYKEYNLQNGTDIILQTVPVDPYDLFRGDYVILSYSISRMQVPNNTYEVGNTIYVALEEELPVGITRGVGVSTTAPNGQFIKGKIIDLQKTELKEKDNVLPQTFATIKYGIESYFVPEEKGIEVEKYRGNELTVRVSVNKRGESIIKDLLLNGEKVLFNSKQ